MDNVLVDFKSGVEATPVSEREAYADDGTGHDHYDDIPGIFSRMKPVDGAIEAVQKLSEYYDCYILSTAPWGNLTALNEKIEWVKRYFNHTVPEVEIGHDETNDGNPFYKKTIFTHHKELCKQEGAWLIDDRTKHGASEFGDHHIQFLTDSFPNWPSVVDFLIKQAKK